MTDGERPMRGLQAIVVALAERGVTDRAQRLRAVSAIVDRTVTSGNELSAAEIKLVLETLQKVRRLQ